MLTTISLILGLIGLWLGTELVIRGALEISDQFKLSRVFVGLTILAIGTDLPELMVSITGGIEKLQGVQTGGLIIGNIIGSCMAQLIFTLGLAGMFSYFILSKKQIFREGSILLGSIILVFLFSFDGQITRFEGLSLIIVYIFYFFSIKREEHKPAEDIERAPSLHLGWSIASLIGGLFIVVYSADVVVGSATELALAWGLTQSSIGIFIVGIGTTLPEIALSLGAVFKGSPGLSIGNLAGSNIFDLLFVLGTGAAIGGIDVPRYLVSFDIPFLFLATSIVLILFSRKKGIQKAEASALLVVYGFYVILKLLGY